MKKTTAAETPAATKHSKEQLLGSARFRNCRDLLDALLEDGGIYTLDEVDALLTNYMKGKVK